MQLHASPSRYESRMDWAAVISATQDMLMISCVVYIHNYLIFKEYCCTVKILYTNHGLVYGIDYSDYQIMQSGMLSNDRQLSHNTNESKAIECFVDNNSKKLVVFSSIFKL